MTETREPFEPFSEWRSQGTCATPENRKLYFEDHDIWFSPDLDDPEYDEEQVERDQKKALSLCLTDCPVRDLCLRGALEDQRIHGTRGGLTEEQTRVTLSVDDSGKEVRRGGYPDCPYCFVGTEHLRTTKIALPEGGRWNEAKAVKCSSCGFEWKSRSSHNAVLAYQAEQEKIAEQIRNEQIAKERLS